MNVMRAFLKNTKSLNVKCAIEPRTVGSFSPDSGVFINHVCGVCNIVVTYTDRKKYYYAQNTIFVINRLTFNLIDFEQLLFINC